MGLSRARGFASLLIVMGLAGCSHSAPALEQRMRRDFDIPASQPVNEQTIRLAIFMHVPRGSSLAAVQTFLDQHGLGKDRFSACDRQVTDGMIICHIADAPKAFEFVKTSFMVSFAMRRDGTLDDV